MNTKTVEQYRAELTLPHSTVTITSDDPEKIQALVRNICKAENIQPQFDNKTSNLNSIFVLDDTGSPLGTIAAYEVHQTMSVGHLVGARRQAQRAA